MKTYHLSSVYELTPEILSKIGVKCLILDVDNTIRKYNSALPDDKTKAFISKLKSEGITILLCTNNFKKAIKPFADALHCDLIDFSLKPSPLGMLRAWIRSKACHSEIMVVGDQVFNDILAGKLMLFKTMLVSPIDSNNEPSSVTVRRKMFKSFEKKILNNINPF
ncbi:MULTISPECIES: YqeG family HAD IIIA-type phosphatase [unclassified Ruminococcus]|uniref:YqeG family HAD IIIA-type phosphatase n=1 Tax=unclassified Ruminococcus TaxID=2608920 RepID=UPI0021086027|nr:MULTISPECIES: HAD family hydrolase [unclassified Ruminococcus]MCQ4021643.1 HAD family hydrolase [Ruminococcus sp. zg-924]MCQ4114088.1 HAD family hydrolase [Ruminococcus sp. zg-921]